MWVCAEKLFSKDTLFSFQNVFSFLTFIQMINFMKHLLTLKVLVYLLLPSIILLLFELSTFSRLNLTLGISTGQIGL